MLSKNNSTTPRSIGLMFVLICLLYLLHRRHHHIDSNLTIESSAEPAPQRSTNNVGLISFVHGYPTDDYAAVIESHERYARRHHYPLFLERSEFDAGRWYQTLSILSILVEQLGKSPTDSVKWLMIYDTKSLVVNPNIPLELFLPPSGFDDVHFVATKNRHIIDTDTFFIRVHPWSIRFLSKILGSPSIKPSWEADRSSYSAILMSILNETDSRSNILYQPRNWYNAYQLQDGFEGRPGDMTVRFKGDADEVEHQMHSWLKVLRSTEGLAWQPPFEQTTYLNETSRYWEVVRNARAILASAQEHLRSMPESAWDSELVAVVDKLWYVIYHTADRENVVRKATARVEELLHEKRGSLKHETYGNSRHRSSHSRLHVADVSKIMDEESSLDGVHEDVLEIDDEDDVDIHHIPLGSSPRGSGGDSLSKQHRVVPGQKKAYGAPPDAPHPTQSELRHKKKYDG